MVSSGAADKPSGLLSRVRELVSRIPDPGSLSDARELLQRRVKQYVGFLLALFGTFYVLDMTDLVIHRGVASLAAIGPVAHLALVIALAVSHQLLRTRTLPASALGALEAAVTLGIAVIAVAVLDGIPRGDLAAGPFVAINLVLVARAAIVPSTGTRTLAVGGLSSMVVVAGYTLLRPGAPFTQFTLPWMVAFTLAAAYSSRVIYGLQEQVRQARQLGQYVLDERLGQGGMGVVYRARHQLLRRPTAVKLMSADRGADRDSARFEDEVKSTARLSHRNTVTVYDYGRTSDGVFYYAMELLEGATLEAVVAAAGALPPARTVGILAAVAGALAEAHGIQLIHRDIKPANIMLCEQGGEVDVVKVLDFGLVKDLASDVELTQEGSLTGTPAFMSPESIRDPRSVGPASDIYALGAVGYYLLTGEHVFTGQTVVEICSHHLLTEPTPLSERTGRAFPAALEALILDCLAKTPEQRPATALELRSRLLALDGLDAWSEADARSWWSTHREELRHSTAQPTSELSATLAVDMARRS